LFISKIMIFSFILILVSIMILPFSLEQESELVIVKEGNPLLVIDDFSKDPSSTWIFQNAAYWNTNSENIMLTEPGSERVGVMWLRNNISSPMTIEFSYKIGGGSGADGLIFMFYKDWDYEPGIGGFLGFHCREVEKSCPRKDAPGYGIEFDNYYNSKEEYGKDYGEGDPSSNHIALLKDFIGNHLTHVNDTRTEDNIWHDVRLIVQNDIINLFIDDEKTLTWTGMIDRSHNHLGFGSGIWGYDHQHIIDNFKLYGHKITVNGLNPGWKIQLFSGDSRIGEANVPEENAEAIIDVSGFSAPIKGYFKVFNESELIFESSTFENIWGGDIWSLQEADSNDSLTPFDDSSWNPQTIAVTISFIGIIILLIFLVYKRRQ